MAHPVEAMDVDDDFDDKENALFRNNAQPRTPCMEKGYEELDVSELNMKLRYSMTPVSSPMSKSYTTNLVTDLQNSPVSDNNNSNITQTPTSIMTRSDITSKSSRLTPLQMISTDQFADNKRTTSVLKPLESAYTGDANDIAITVSQPNDLDDNLSLPSTSSSLVHTPEATTPTKEVVKSDGGSPIMRGIKSVLNMFRSSQSPIPPVEDAKSVARDLTLPDIEQVNESELKTALASTPISSQKRQNLSKGSSPLKDSVTFNEDLEKELLWKDETTIIFSKEKLPIHKLFYPQPKPTTSSVTLEQNSNQNLDSTVEYMDISYNSSMTKVPDDEKEYTVIESDSEFVDCETTFTKNDSVLENNKINVQPLEHIVDLKKGVEANRNVSSDELKETLVKSEVTDDRDKDKAVSKMSMNMTINLPDTDIVKFSNSVVKSPDNKRQESCITSSTMILNDREEVENNKSKIGDNENDFESLKHKINAQPLEHVDSKKSVEANRHIHSDELKEILVKSTNMTIDLPDTNVVKFLDSVVSNSENKGPESAITSSTMILNDREEAENNKSKIGDNKNDFELLQSKTDVQSLEHVNSKNGVESICISAHEIHKTLMKYDEIHEMDETVSKIPLDMAVRFPEANAGEVITSLVPIPQIETPEIMSDTMILYDGEEKEDISYLINENVNKKIDCIIDNNVILLPECTPDVNINNTSELLASEAITNITNEKLLSKGDSRIADDPKLELEECLENSETTAKKDTHIAHLVLNETSDNAKNDYVNIVVKGLENPVSSIDSVDSKPCEMKFYSEQSTTQTLDSNMDRICDDEIVNLLKKIDVIVEAESSDLVDRMKICSSFTDIDKTLANVDITFSLDHEENQMKRNVPIGSGIIIPEKNDEPATEIKNVCAIPDLVCDTVISSDNITSALTEKQKIIVEHNENHLNENFMLPTTSSDEITTNLKNKTSTHTDDNQNNKNLTINTDNIIATPSDGADCNLVTLKEVRDTNMLQSNDINDDLIITVNPLPASSNDVTLLLTNSEENQNDNISENKMENNINEILTLNMGRFIPTITSEDINTDTKNSIENQNIEIDISKCNSAEVPSKINEKRIEEILCSEEEVAVSEINNPYVSISVETESKSIGDFEETVNPFNTKKSNSAITLSPPITSKGYNFNFDTIDDPFATKTRLSISPSSESFPKPISEPTISKSVEKIDSVGKNLNKNRRKSQPEFRKSVNCKIKQNQSFESVSNILQEKVALQTSSNITIKNEEFNVSKNNSNNCEYLQQSSIYMEIKTDSIMENESNFEKDGSNLLNLTELAKIQNKTEISILNEQTVESQDRCIDISYNTGTTSTEGVGKNVFNLPEIDDRNFNPFANKLKTLQSFETTGDLLTTSINFPNDANDDVHKSDTTIVIYNKESSIKQKQVIDNKDYENINNTTGSSDEKNITVKEVHTDDEDTIEGPFLEAGELDNDENLVEFQTEKVDMMNFSDVPAQVNEETDELFIDAETFDFLMNKNTNEVADSGKESLFLKFDPLFSGKAKSDGVGAVLSVLKQRQSTPHKSPQSQAHVTFDKSAIAGSSTFNLSHDGDVTHLEDINIDSNNSILSKPMMVVTPAVNPVVTPRNKIITPTNTNRRSMTYTSPAMAVIDRLLSLSSNNSMVNLEATLSEEQNEADLALLELREVLAVKEDHVQQLRLESEELKDRLSGLESHLRSLEIESEERLNRVNDLTERLNEKTQINKSMATVVEEYERTISSLISETEQDKKLHAEERRRLINERDEQTAHLSSMEVSFSDLHSKYEKSKQVILGYKANEEAYKKSIKEFEENFDKMQSNYELLKQHATTQLNHANQELVKMNRAHESEVLKMNAMIKRKDLYITSLEESLAQKTKANEELTAICDELINKVG